MSFDGLLWFWIYTSHTFKHSYGTKLKRKVISDTFVLIVLLLGFCAHWNIWSPYFAHPWCTGSTKPPRVSGDKAVALVRQIATGWKSLIIARFCWFVFMPRNWTPPNHWNRSLLDLLCYLIVRLSNISSDLVMVRLYGSDPFRSSLLFRSGHLGQISELRPHSLCLIDLGAARL
jgi:hypothetical protein